MLHGTVRCDALVMLVKDDMLSLVWLKNDFNINYFHLHRTAPSFIALKDIQHCTSASLEMSNRLLVDMMEV